MNREFAERINREHEVGSLRSEERWPADTCLKCKVKAPCDARLAAEAVLRMLPVVEAAVQFRDDVGDLVYPGDPFIAAVDAYRAALAEEAP